MAPLQIDRSSGNCEPLRSTVRSKVAPEAVNGSRECRGAALEDPAHVRAAEVRGGPVTVAPEGARRPDRRGAPLRSTRLLLAEAVGRNKRAQSAKTKPQPGMRRIIAPPADRLEA